jgi:hypothetical protein
MCRVALLVGLLITVGSADAQAPTTYPYYYRSKDTGKHWYSEGTGSSRYYYTHYHYGPAAHQYHHVYYYPSRSGKYLYYYNWDKKRYWGRYDLEAKGYSLLEPSARKENLDDIPATAFPAPAPVERIAIPVEDGGPKVMMTKPPSPPRD